MKIIRRVKKPATESQVVRPGGQVASLETTSDEDYEAFAANVRASLPSAKADLPSNLPKKGRIVLGQPGSPGGGGDLVTLLPGGTTTDPNITYTINGPTRE